MNNKCFTMPPTKRKKSDQRRQCICGAIFATPKAYGNHMVHCNRMAIYNRNATRQLHHSLAAQQRRSIQHDELGAALSAPRSQGIAGHSAPPNDFSLRQQRNIITKQRPEMDERLAAQLHNEHADKYVSQLRHMKSNCSVRSLPGSSMNDELGSMGNMLEMHAANANEGYDELDDDAYDDNNNNNIWADEPEDISIASLGDKSKCTSAGDNADNTSVHHRDLERTFPLITDDKAKHNIRYKGTVSPATAAGIKLMALLAKHTTDLSLYDDVVEYISNLADTGYDFQQKIPKRVSLHNTCEQAFNYTQLQPKLIDVTVATLPVPKITVPVFDIQAVLRKMLCNPQLMRQEHFAADYDIFSGTSCARQDGHAGGVEYYDEIHTGLRWKKAVEHYCANDETMFPCGLVVFYDKSHSDRHGSLSVSPIMFTLTLFNKTARSKSQFWDIIAYIPNLDYGSTKSSDNSIAQVSTPALKCQDEHSCLFQALRQLKEANDSGGIPMQILGKFKKVKVWIHIMVGDISGNNSLLGSFNNANVKCPYRDCGCTKEDFVDPTSTCTFIKKADIDQLKQQNDIAGLKAVSKHNIVNAFDIIPTGDPVDTIYLSTPPETMHAIDAGIIPRMIQTIGDGFKRKQVAAAMHNLHLLLVNSHARQSERDLPRPSQRNHLLETTKTQATENKGNLFLLLCALHTQMGISAADAAGIKPSERKGKITTMKMILAVEKWFNRRNRRSDIDDTTKINAFVRTVLIPNLQKYFPREAGQQWMFPKVHSLTKFDKFIQAFGSGINFYGGFGESHLKVFMKHYAHFTQRRPVIFAQQLAQNHYRQSLFDHSLHCISAQLKDDYELVQTQSCGANFSGEHDITFIRRHTNLTNTVNVDGVQFSANVVWKRSSTTKLVDNTFQYAVSRYMAQYGHVAKFRVTGYTTAKLANAPETLEEYDAIALQSMYKVDTQTDRNDWCMILTHELGSEVNDERLNVLDYLCPARIHGFFCFQTPGLPTPHLLQSEDADTIKEMARMDNTMYVVVRTHRHFLNWEQLEKEFILPIQLGDLDECTYIFPVSRIVNPLYVFKDHGQSTTDVSFFASIPARYWGFYLDYKLNTDSTPGPCGFSQKCEEDTVEDTLT